MGESKMRGEQVSRRACKHEGVHACVRARALAGPKPADTGLDDRGAVRIF